MRAIVKYPVLNAFCGSRCVNVNRAQTSHVPSVALRAPGVLRDPVDLGRPAAGAPCTRPNHNPFPVSLFAFSRGSNPRRFRFVNYAPCQARGGRFRQHGQRELSHSNTRRPTMRHEPNRVSSPQTRESCHQHKRRFRAAASLVAAVALWLTPAPSAQAATVAPLSPEQVIFNSDIIFEGVVTAATPRWADGGQRNIVTDYTFRIDRRLRDDKGVLAQRAVGRSITLTFAGGEIGDRAVDVHGVPKFARVNEHAFLCINSGNLGTLAPTLGMWHGVYRVAQRCGERRRRRARHARHGLLRGRDDRRSIVLRQDHRPRGRFHGCRVRRGDRAGHPDRATEG